MNNQSKGTRGQGVQAESNGAGVQGRLAPESSEFCRSSFPPAAFCRLLPPTSRVFALASLLLRSACLLLASACFPYPAACLLLVVANWQHLQRHLNPKTLDRKVSLHTCHESPSTCRPQTPACGVSARGVLLVSFG